MINEQILKGSWNEFRGKIQQKFGQLSDDDIQSYSGQVNQLVGLIQRKTGVSRENIESFLEELTENAPSSIGRVAGQAKEYVRHAGEMVQEQTEHASQAIKTRLTDAEKTVRENPGSSVVAAFGFGILAGVILASCARR